MVFWYIFPVLVCCTKKNLATLEWSSFFADFVIISWRKEESLFGHQVNQATELLRIFLWENNDRDSDVMFSSLHNSDIVNGTATETKA
jgi:hypothetical protein